jgi:FkbM family methyltransferase
VLKSLDRFTGGPFFEDLASFLQAFSALFEAFRQSSRAVQALLRADSTRFLVVTAPYPGTVREAIGFRAELVTRGFPFAGFVCNRVHDARPAASLEALASALGGDVRIESVLLGDQDCDGRAFHQLRTPFGSTGSSLYDELSDYPRDVLTLPMRRLDSLVRSHEGRTFDLVKIDVQGAELDVLRGAGAMINSVQALCIELSLHPVNRGAPLLAEVVATLDQLGFLMFDAVPLPRDGGLQKQIDAVFVRKHALG